MSREQVGILVGVIVLVVFLAGALWLFLFLRARERKRIAGMSPEERELHDATLEYAATVKAAEKGLREHEKARAAQLAAATAGVKAADGIGNRTIAAYRGTDGYVSTTDLALTFNGQAFYIDSSFRAAADTAGNLATSSRTTLTRVAAGGIIFGPAGAIVGAVAKKNKVIDTRELYLLVESATFSGVITCKPDDGPRVRQVAAAINNAARNVETVKVQRASAIESSHEHLALAEADTAGVEAAAKYLDWARSNVARRDGAALAVESARQRLAIEPPLDSETDTAP